MLTMMMWSLGFLLLPRRIKLDTYLGEPLQMKVGESSEQYAARVKLSLQNLIDAKSRSDPVYIQHVGIIDCLSTFLVGFYTLVQNIFFVAVLSTSFWIPLPGILFYTFWKFATSKFSVEPRKLD
jgi:hypothetical protein